MLVKVDGRKGLQKSCHKASKALVSVSVITAQFYFILFYSHFKEEENKFRKGDVNLIDT